MQDKNNDAVYVNMAEIASTLSDPSKLIFHMEICFSKLNAIVLKS